MESTTLRSNTAAILAALGKLGHGQDGHVKKDDAKTDSEMKKEPDSPAAVKMEASAETASLNKKRKLWTAAAQKNLPGDKTFLEAGTLLVIAMHCSQSLESCVGCTAARCRFMRSGDPEVLGAVPGSVRKSNHGGPAATPV